MNNHLGVALGMKHMAQSLQLGNEGLVVVDFAIEDHHHGAIFIK